MRRLIVAIIVLVGVGLLYFFQRGSDVDESVTTYFLIRHAEKELVNNPNPPLNQAGMVRAAKWVDFFRDTPLDEVWSTDYYRTINTVKPVATDKAIEIGIYDPGKIDYDDFIENTKGKKVLIVGHSNTIPQFVNSLIGIKKYSQIEDAEYSNLYVVTFAGNSVSDMLVHIN